MTLEKHVYQENLDSFLVIAEELQLKGLKSNDEEAEVANQSQIKNQIYEQSEEIYSDVFEGNEDNLLSKKSNNIIALPTIFSGQLTDLDRKVKSMMEKNENQRGHKCKICGKEGHGNDIRKHIEANHLEGINQFFWRM